MDKHQIKNTSQYNKLKLAFIVAVTFQIPALIANPQLPVVVEGAASFNGLGTSNLNITNSPNTVINWNQFNIDAGQTTHFSQVNSASSVLNRVRGADPSDIYGTLSSNGQVFVINPNGILVGAGATIDTAGFIASTLNITDQDFLKGNFHFEDAGNLSEIINQGFIHTTGTGEIVLIAPNVKNENILQTEGGDITLAAGQSITLSALSDPNISFEIQAPENQVINIGELLTNGGSASIFAGSIKNSGNINVDGLSLDSQGRVVLFASDKIELDESSLISANGVKGGDINIEAKQLTLIGEIDADGINEGGNISIQSDGFVALGGNIHADGASGGGININAGVVSLAEKISARGTTGKGGSVNIYGAGQNQEINGSVIDVSGAQGGDITHTAGEQISSSGHYIATGSAGSGGSIDISAPATKLLSATLDVSGTSSGGRIRVGGEFQGGKNLQEDELANAQILAINDGSVIRADGIDDGSSGGNIILWSDQKTAVYADISAVPGEGGAGGFIEISSGDTLAFAGQAAAGPKGSGATVLLDPKNINIDTTNSSSTQYALILGFNYNNILDVSGNVLDDSDQFGASVALNDAGTRLAVGATGDAGFDNTGSSVGAVHLFSFTDTNFSGGALVGSIGSGYTGGNNLDISASLEDFDSFGASVALNALGDRLVVGAPEDSGLANVGSGNGAVYMFSFIDGNFSGGSLTGTIGEGYAGATDLDLALTLDDFDQFGTSVSLNAAGDRLAVGAVIDDGFGGSNFNSGAVHLISFADGNFSTGLLTGTIGSGYAGVNDVNLVANLDNSDQFGQSVALNGTGNRLVIGAQRDSGFGNSGSSIGAAYLISFADVNFTSGSLTGIIGEGYVGVNDLNLSLNLDDADSFGSSLAFNTTGDGLIVGAMFDDGFGNSGTNNGAAYLITFTDANFSAASLTGTIGESYVAVGDIDLSFTLDDFDGFGAGLALNDAGDRLAVGSFRDAGLLNVGSNIGATNLFTFTDTSFNGGQLAGIIGQSYTGTTSFSPLFIRDSLGGSDNFGQSVALNDAGNRLAIGSPGDDSTNPAIFANLNSGAVYLFSFTDTNFSGGALSATIGNGFTGGKNLDLGSTLSLNDNFGSSVAFNGVGDRLAVGGKGDSGFGDLDSANGAVYLITFTDDEFSGGVLTGTMGEAYVGANDLDLTNLLDQDDNFGSSVALNSAGDRLAVGAINDDGSGVFGTTNEGAVHLFTFADANFTGAALVGSIGQGFSAVNNLDLTNSLDPDDNFGSSVGLNDAGNRLVVGALNDDGFGISSLANEGAAYFITFTDNNFAGAALAGTIGTGYVVGNDFDLTGSLDANDNFGSAVSLNGTGDRLVIGSFRDDGVANGSNAHGAVYMISFADVDFNTPALTGIIGNGYTGGNNFDTSGTYNVGDFLGSGLSFNSAGDRLAIGASGDTGFAGDAGFFAGAVSLFTFADGDFNGGAISGTIGDGYTGAGDIPLFFSESILNNVDFFGRSVALNTAGDRLAVGAADDNGFVEAGNNIGAVQLFTFTDGDFSGGAYVGTIGEGYTGGNNLNLAANLDDTDFFATSVSLNSAGDRLAVGAINDQGSFTGGVYLITFTDTSFSSPALAGRIGRNYVGVNDIDVASTIDGGDSFGISLALNGLGDRLFVGSTSDDGALNIGNATGAVHLFTFADTNFTGGVHAGSIGEGYTGGSSFDISSTLDDTDGFGSSLALNEAGDRLIVYAGGDDGFNNLTSQAGAIHLITFADGDFNGAAISGTLGSGYVGGTSVDLGATGISVSSLALNSVGDRLAVGDSGDNGFDGLGASLGAIKLFTFLDSNFNGASLFGTIGEGYVGVNDIDISAALDNSDLFGTSVAFNGVGDRLVSGASQDRGIDNSGDRVGAVHMFTFTDANYSGGEFAGTIGLGYESGFSMQRTVSALETNDFFGTSVALNDAGDRLAVGADGDDGLNNIDNANGAVHLFTFTDGIFSGGALSGIIGEGYTGGNNLDISAVLDADGFGQSVAFNAAGDRLAVGADEDDGFGNSGVSLGAVHLFMFEDTNFTGAILSGTIGEGYLTTNDLDISANLGDNDFFGTSVGLNSAGDRLVAGSGDPGVGRTGNGNGAVFMFTFADANFTAPSLAGIIGEGYTGGNNIDLSAELENNDFFGQSVALNGLGDRLVVGAYQDGGFANVSANSGAVRLFTFTDVNFAGGALVGTIGAGYVGVNDLDLSTTLDANDNFGFSVALNTAGNRLVVGAISDDGFANTGNATGAAHLFDFIDADLNGVSLRGTIGEGYVGVNDLDISLTLDDSDQFGIGVAINGVGDQLAVGSFADDGILNSASNTGSVNFFQIFTNTSGSVGDGVFATNPGTDLTLTVDTITAITDSGTAVILQASNDITQNAGADINTVASGLGGDITLQAGRSIILNADINTDGGAFTAVANSRAADGVIDADRDAGAAVIQFADNSTVTTAGGNVVLRIDDGLGLTNNIAGDITIGADGAGVNAGAGSITVENRNAGQGLVMASGTGPGVLLNNNNFIRLILDTLDLQGTGFTHMNSALLGDGGDIFIEPFTTATTIGLGGGAGVLNLTANELETLNLSGTTDGTLSIGNTVSGDIQVDAYVASNQLNMSFITGGSFAVATNLGSAVNLNLNIRVDGNNDSIESLDLSNITANIFTLDGGTDNNDSLLANNQVNSWAVTSVNSGALNSSIFTNFSNLTGNAADDVFTLSGGSLTGTIDGAGGNNTLIADNIANTWLITSINAGTLNGSAFSNMANLTGNAASDIFNLTGGGGSLTGFINGAGGTNSLAADNIANTWLINGADSGILNSIVFIGISDLTGNANTDTFTLAGGTISGTIDGAAGNNTLLGDNQANAWSITGLNSGDLNGGLYSNINNLTGNAGVDTYTITGGSIAGTINANAGVDTVELQTGTLDLAVTAIQNVEDIVLSGGLLTGAGTISANLTNNAGLIGVGSATGSINVIGDYTQGASGALEIKLGGLVQGVSYDSLNASGNVTLDGVLDVIYTGGFTASTGDQFDVIQSQVSNITGSFTTTNLPSEIAFKQTVAGDSVIQLDSTASSVQTTSISDVNTLIAEVSTVQDTFLTILDDISEGSEVDFLEKTNENEKETLQCR
ncbi:MAG: hypothetical protein DIZ80_07595 [endosymbiont of Galathealinum brachiosum]|uniref:Filamentous haemagglutinin FhaB/tRNA nuclease CdiA-like TPS domain-containing protein n=1 Tax=endosymbiont of Galathealinum brachiosum TaxID=2200906 RepID=A0A370DGE5_9GAMM|nr:MAG: hypothetical protein DIZ80_07595 [endosymbiont of Galathealinum brachiosum]